MASEKKKTESKAAGNKRDERFKVSGNFAVAVLDSRDLTKERVEELMREHGVTDVDEPFDESGATTLFAASLEGILAAVTALLEAGASVDNATTTGETPLLLAADSGHAECVIALITARANVDKAATDGETPLWQAAFRGHASCVQALIEARANVDKALTNGETPLWRAAWRGHASCVHALIDGKADVDKAQTLTSISPLFMAAKNGHASCVQALIEAGADVDKANNNRCTPLFMAAQEGHASCVHALIEAGADLNAKRDNGATAVMAASANKHVECVRLLIRAGAKVEAECQDGKLSAVDLADGNATILNELRKICSRCKKGLKKRYFCSICFTVAYCSQECSDAAWPEHESKCGPCPRCDGCRWGMTNETAIVQCCLKKARRREIVKQLAAMKRAKAQKAKGDDTGGGGDEEKTDDDDGASEEDVGVRRYCNEACRQLGWPKHEDECIEGFAVCPVCDVGFPKLMACVGCGTVSYCSVDCQRTGWQAGHKNECKKRAAEKGRPATATAKKNKKNETEKK